MSSQNPQGSSSGLPRPQMNSIPASEAPYAIRQTTRKVSTQRESSPMSAAGTPKPTVASSSLNTTINPSRSFSSSSTSSTSSTRALGDFFSRAKSGVQYIDRNTKGYRQAIAAGAGNVVATVKEAIDDDNGGSGARGTSSNSSTLTSRSIMPKSETRPNVIDFTETSESGIRTDSPHRSASSPQLSPAAQSSKPPLPARSGGPGASIPQRSKTGASTTSSTNSRQTWSAWATQKISSAASSAVNAGMGSSPSRENWKDTIQLMPGWVVRKPRAQKEGEAVDGVAPFDLIVTTSGFTSALRTPEYASRSQKIFMRIAKGFAALPKMIDATAATAGASDMFPEDEGKLTDEPEPLPPASEPPSPGGVRWKGAEVDLEGFETKGESDGGVNTPASLETPMVPSSGGKDQTGRPVSRPSSQYSRPSVDPFLENVTPDQLKVYHENLDTRLQPLWASVTQRRVQLSIWPVQKDKLPFEGDDNPAHEPNEDEEPLLRNVFMTTPQGLFAQRITIPWERILSHGPSVKMAFSHPPDYGDESEKQSPDGYWGLYIKAEVIADGVEGLNGTITPTASDKGANAYFSPAAEPISNGSAGTGGGFENTGRTSVVSTSFAPLSIDAGIRVLSDLDDTVKRSNILMGAREVFRNAFCKPVEACCVEGMPQLYWRMVEEGAAGFHYASNSPYELLPIIRQFFRVHHFPAGYSLNLKYYGGKNLLNGLFEPPAERKKPKVVEVMDSFPNSQFILVGDSGEQDLELYVQIAKERPKQVLAILIRDVTTTFISQLRIPALMLNAANESGRSTASGGQDARAPPAVSDLDLAALEDALLIDGSRQERRAGIGGKARRAMGLGDAREPGEEAVKASTLTPSSGNRTPREAHARKEQERDQELPAESVSEKVASGTAIPTGGPSSLSSSSRASSRAKGSEIPSSVTSGSLGAPNVGLEGVLTTEPKTQHSFTGSGSRSSSTPVSSTTSQLHSLSAQEQKLLRRSLEWADRMKRALNEVPLGVKLFFFVEPADIEEKVVAVFREAKARRQAESKARGGENPHTAD